MTVVRLVTRAPRCGWAPELSRGSGYAHELGPEPGSSALRIHDVQVHVRLVSDSDLVGGAKADELAIDLPDQAVLGALVERAREVLLK